MLPAQVVTLARSFFKWPIDRQLLYCYGCTWSATLFSVLRHKSVIAIEPFVDSTVVAVIHYIVRLLFQLLLRNNTVLYVV